MIYFISEMKDDQQNKQKHPTERNDIERLFCRPVNECELH